MRIRLFVIDSSGDKQEITDLYWFEENGVRDFGGDAFYDKYTFTMSIDDGEEVAIESGTPFKW